MGNPIENLRGSDAFVRVRMDYSCPLNDVGRLFPSVELYGLRSNRVCGDYHVPNPAQVESSLITSSLSKFDGDHVHMLSL
jgi:hypothetical protein